LNLRYSIGLRDPSAVLAEAELRLREAERTAAEALDQGCSNELAAIAVLVDRPLRRARERLGRSLRIEQVTEIALRCKREIFANADVRFRARYGFYTEALAEAEREFLEVARRVTGAVGLRERRKVALPHIGVVDDRSETLALELSLSSDIDASVEKLRKRICNALVCEVERSRKVVIKRGRASLARTLVALRLAVHDQLAL